MSNRKSNQLLQHGTADVQTTPLVINLDDYYSQKETAIMFGVDERTIFNWRKDKKLKAREWNGHVLFEKGLIDIAVERYKRLGFF